MDWQCFCRHPSIKYLHHKYIIIILCFFVYLILHILYYILLTSLWVWICYNGFRDLRFTWTVITNVVIHMNCIRISWIDLYTVHVNRIRILYTDRVTGFGYEIHIRITWIVNHGIRSIRSFTSVIHSSSSLSTLIFLDCWSLSTEVFFKCL